MTAGARATERLRRPAADPTAHDAPRRAGAPAAGAAGTRSRPVPGAAAAAPGRRPPPPVVRWAPPPGTPPHDVPQPFLLAMRSRDWAWWRPLLGLLLFAVVYLRRPPPSSCSPTAGHRRSARPGAAGPRPTRVTLLVTNLSADRRDPVRLAGLGRSRTAWDRAGRPPCSAGCAGGCSLPLRPASRWPRSGVGIAARSLLSASCSPATTVTGPVASFGWLLVVVLLTTPAAVGGRGVRLPGLPRARRSPAGCGRPRAGAVAGRRA